MSNFNAPASTRSAALPVGTRIGRFVIRAVAGAGGMGEVYEAEDPALGRRVALKRLGHWLPRDPRARERALQEAQRCSSVGHPNIATIYDIIESGDDLFIVMEWIDGQTLRKRMQRPLPVPEVLDIAIQSTEALAAAHTAGIVHRDIKPENIMLACDGRVRVLDFGVARKFAGLGEVDRDLTVQLSGTPAYMAPELLLEREPDPRSDVFSLGVVLYEALSGQNPFKAATLIETASRILDYPPPLLSSVRSEVSPELSEIIGRMMAKNPAARYTTARELLEELRRVSVPTAPAAEPVPDVKRPVALSRHAIALIVIAVLTIVGFTGWFSFRKRSPAPTPVVFRDIAVLPFSAAAEQPVTRAFSDGLSETLSAKLSQLGERYALQIVPAAEVRAQKISDSGEAARILGVSYIIEGTLRQAGSQVRVTYALVDAKTRRQLRADAITGSAADPFAVEDRVVESVLHSLNVELAPNERQALAAHRPAEPGAYDFYLQGRGYMQEFHKRESVQAAISVFQRALERDPNFGLAYAGLGQSYWLDYELTKNRALTNKALEACSRAATLEAAAAEPHVCLGLVYNGTGKYERAVAEFEQAIKLQPSSDEAYAGLAAAYEGLNKLAEAEQTLRAALSLRPNYWGGYNRLGAYLFRHARYREAADFFRKVTELAPDNFRGYNNLGGVYLAMGNYPEAVSVLERSVAIHPNADALSNLGTAYFSMRQFANAVGTYERALHEDQTTYVLWANLGESYYWTARPDDSRRVLTKAVEIARENLRVNPRDSAIISDIAWYEGMLGDRTAALRYLKAALKITPSDPEILFKAALTYSYIGDGPTALDWLERAINAGCAPSRITDTPAFDRLKSDSRYVALIQKH